MKTSLLRPLPLALSILLAACATAPASGPKPTLVAKPSAPAAPAPPASPAVAPAPDVWEQLRDSFTMADCDADPAILAWAHRFTRNSKGFEAQMNRALPRLAYAQQSAARHGVAGEFVLLPWVESRFRPVASHKNRPAGMWQIMPVTARSLGLHVDASYDGRLDVPAATDAVMAMLRRYHDQFQDWRLTDYAYNAGEYAVRRAIKQKGMPAAKPVIPRLPVRKAAPDHLTKLLAIACVIRDPARFHVSLPPLSPERRLVTVELDQSMPIGQAAARAGMSAEALARLNSAFRHGVIDVRSSNTLLLPHGRAEQFRNSMDLQASQGNDDLTASVSDHPGLPPLAANENTPIQPSLENTPVLNDGRPALGRHPKTHIVKAGESLWVIAHRHHLSIAELERWNHLKGRKIKPGQSLRLYAPN
jgi:membrane-bound lytic murein transglycosylase D